MQGDSYDDDRTVNERWCDFDDEREDSKCVVVKMRERDSGCRGITIRGTRRLGSMMMMRGLGVRGTDHDDKWPTHYTGCRTRDTARQRPAHDHTH